MEVDEAMEVRSSDANIFFLWNFRGKSNQKEDQGAPVFTNAFKSMISHQANGFVLF